MRIRTSILLLVFALSACNGDQADTPTTQQAAQLEMLRSAAVQQTERLMGRPLSEGEKACIVVQLKKGKLDSFIRPPLSEELKERQEELNRKYAATRP